MDTYIGMDLGGTKLLIGEVDANGKILASKKYKSGYRSQAEAFQILVDSLEDYKQSVGWKGTPKALGIGVIGRVDSVNSIWYEISPGGEDRLDIGKVMQERFGFPCYADNDVKSATRAVMLWGEGKTSKDFMYLNIGTGIAVGTVVDGRIVKGGHFNAGEVGHAHGGLNLGVECCCGRKDCAEIIAAGVGFDACARLLKDKYRTSLVIPEKGLVQARDVYELCEKGDELCKVLVDNASTVIANLIMDILRLTDPDTIVLGGGVISNGGMYDKVMAKLNPHTIRFVTGGIKLTELNPEFVGLLGAAAVAMKQ